MTFAKLTALKSGATMFRACHKGFQLTFKNGVTVSVMWGASNYCANRYKTQMEIDKDAATIGVYSPTAEVLIWWDGTNDYITAAHGYLNTDQVAAIIDIASRPSLDYHKLNEYIPVEELWLD